MAEELSLTLGRSFAILDERAHRWFYRGCRRIAEGFDAKTGRRSDAAGPVFLPLQVARRSQQEC